MVKLLDRIRSASPVLDSCLLGACLLLLAALLSGSSKAAVYVIWLVVEIPSQLAAWDFSFSAGPTYSYDLVAHAEGPLLLGRPGTMQHCGAVLLLMVSLVLGYWVGNRLRINRIWFRVYAVLYVFGAIRGLSLIGLDLTQLLIISLSTFVLALLFSGGRSRGESDASSRNRAVKNA